MGDEGSRGARALRRWALGSCRSNFSRGVHASTGSRRVMMIPDKKTKRKNILTAVAILAFMIFLFFFTLYNTGVFDRQI